MNNLITRSARLAVVAMVIGLSFIAPRTAAAMTPTTAPSKPATAKPIDNPALPRVLIIGDSISLGYTAPVRTALEGKANVHRPPGNCQHTGVGLANLKAWLGDGRWDVIHFNWGIWDTHMMDASTGQLIATANESKLAPGSARVRHTPEQYRENLTKLVIMLKATGARLVWATTTPITTRKGERAEAIARYNELTAQVMKEHGVEVDDLYSAVLPEAGKWQGGDGCHFNATGNAMLGERVSNSILAALERGKPAATPATQPAR